MLSGTCNPGDVLVLAAIAGSDAGKVRALESAGVKVAKHPEEIPLLLNS